MKRAALLALLALAPGCAFFWADPDEVQISASPRPAEPEDLVRMREEVARSPEDLARRFELARHEEEKGLLEAAALDYGVVARDLPPRRFTRPWLAFAKVELALGRDRSAQRALHEVLAAVPDDDAWFALNPDYREAALLLAPMLAREERTTELERLHRRFVEQLGGDSEDWPVR